MYDFTIADHGTILLFRPTNDAAKAWLDEVTPEDALHYGGALVVEHRYAENLLAGIREAGFDWGF